MLIIESLIVVAALGFAADEPAAEPFENPEKVELFAAEREVIQWTNAERKKHGLAPLVVDASLVKTARKHTYWMASDHTLRRAGRKHRPGANFGLARRQFLDGFFRPPGQHSQ